MRILCVIAVLMALCAAGPTAAWAQSTSADFSGGSVKISDDNRACSGALEGSLRYNSSQLQYCDGSSWVSDWTCPPPADCTSIGAQCTDLTIFAGCHPIYGDRLFVHPNNQSTGVYYSTESVDNSAVEDLSDGRVNQEWIVANETISEYPAMELCDDLNGSSALGHTDWYLPSIYEMMYLWSVRTAINAGPGDSFVATYYWSSDQESSTSGKAFDFNAGQWNSASKTTFSFDARCVRRD